ncbi:MAG: glycerophosphodiester phosphodiesterase family protein [Azospirillaceae bacterium]
MTGALALPRVVGHRGAAAHAPENTLAGLRAARDLGCTWVEVDVKLSRDGVPILMHDDTLERTTDGRGRVRDHDIDALRRLDAGSRFGPAFAPDFAPDFAGERIPLLAEMLETAADLGLSVDLEIKPCPGREAETAERAIAVASAVWPADRPAPLITSFAGAALDTARRLAGDWPRGVLVRRPPRDPGAAVDRYAPAMIGFDRRYATDRGIADAHAAGLVVCAYTVNEPGEAARLADLGIDCVFSDRPDAVAPVLEE